MSLGKKIIAIGLSFLMNLIFWIPINHKVEGVPERSETATRVISFNVRCANDLYGTVNVRSTLLMSLLKAYAPDSFGVQEATGKWMKILSKKLKDYTYVGEHRDEDKNSEYSAVFYLKDKFNLLDSGTIWLCDTPDEKYTKYEESGCTRIATWATLENKSTGEIYTHINTHLDHVSDTSRNMQVEVLKKKITELEKSGYPVICTGDFNLSEGTDVYYNMTEKLSDSKFIAKETDDGLTYHNYGKITEGEPIDFIFVPADMTVNRYRVMDEMIKGMFISDHYGLCVDVELG